mmetsp:Transcript_36189/g.46929  ORF Transcript_36189/g.46929 Transcript_36189/m.46929 type:complete len:208 (+) Transcript_36189:1411-2034(+)
MGWVVDQTDVSGNAFCRPAAGHQLFTRFSTISGGTDGGNHFVHVGYSHSQTAKDVAALTCFAQQVRCAASHHLFAEVNEGGQKAAQSKLLRTTAIQGQHVAAKVGLHWRKAEQLVQHHLGGGVALKLHNNANTVAVGFILNVGDSFDAFVSGRLGDLFDHGGLVHLIRNLIEDNSIAILADLFDAGFRADDHAATAFEVGFAGARTP